jgi:hypothetical protein
MIKSKTLKLCFWTFLSVFFTSTAQALSYPKDCFGEKNKCRPPQFVALAFDGSNNLSMWQETRTFAKENKLRFTYFVSGVYWLGRNVNDARFSHRNYKKPGSGGSGLSAIGFATDLADINARTEHLVRAHLEGNEIASHAMGHFYGGAPNRWMRDALDWSRAEWNFEFSQFAHFLDQALSYFSLEKIFNSPADKARVVAQISKGIEGFRSPQLSVNDDMWPAMADNAILYDTSEVKPRSFWPKKRHGIWQFPLASIPVPGQSQSILSMDYNLKVKNVGEENTYRAYMNYFQYNYTGNRAPIHIGHHFSLWHNGAYWKALKRFAKSVCSKPEVVCGTYRELRKFMDSVPPEVVARWEKQKFEFHIPKNVPRAIPVGFARSGQGMNDATDPYWRPDPDLSEQELERLSISSCFDEASAH